MPTGFDAVKASQTTARVISILPRRRSSVLSDDPPTVARPGYDFARERVKRMRQFTEGALQPSFGVQDDRLPVAANLFHRAERSGTRISFRGGCDVLVTSSDFATSISTSRTMMLR